MVASQWMQTIPHRERVISSILGAASYDRPQHEVLDGFSAQLHHLEQMLTQLGNQRAT
jgi:hypothetical protein